MAQKKIKKDTDQRPFSMIYHDFYKSNLLDHYEKSLFIALKIFSDSNNQCYPSVKKLADTTGMSERKVRDTLKSLEKKHVISIESRARADGGGTSNLYTLYDFKELWNTDSSEEMAEAVNEYEDNKLISILESKGYTVSKEKGLVSNASQSKDTSTYQKHFTHEKDTTDKPKSQDIERYTLDQIKQLFDYDVAIHDNPYLQQDINSVMDILHTAMNTTKPTIRIAGEDKPSMVVIGKLMKLSYSEVMYAINKYRQQTDRIKNPTSYMLTLLYNSKEQMNLDITNQVQHDMYGQD